MRQSRFSFHSTTHSSSGDGKEILQDMHKKKEETTTTTADGPVTSAFWPIDNLKPKKTKGGI